MRLYLWPIAAALLLASCTSISNLKSDLSERMFGRELAEPPAELVDFKPTIKTKVVWSAHLGKAGLYDFKPAVDNGVVYAASASGEIARFDAASGKQVWRINAGEKLSGGVGLGNNLVLVGSPQGYVLAFDQASGKPLWKAKVSSEVLSAPREDNGIVVVRAGDSRLFGLNAADGSRKWTLDRSTPALALRSSAGIVIDKGVIYAGFAGGKLIAVRVEDGGVLWEATVAQPKGTTEIERIADVTSLPVVDGPLVYAAAYQGRVVAIDRSSGRVVWNRDISSYTGLGVENARVYVSEATGSVYALDYSTGKTFWKQDDLANRLLSAPLSLDEKVAVGDVEGYVHVLSRDDGSFIGRIRTDESPVMPQLTELGSDGLLAQTRDGGLYAISLK
ncbi:MAG TPA: outer membrane protein assembly factor BamB [Methylophilaceae bacterium]|nr:outer membrane protein assembly factor BamB [Methylophilaceae bacterium]